MDPKSREPLRPPTPLTADPLTSGRTESEILDSGLDPEGERALGHDPFLEPRPGFVQFEATFSAQLASPAIRRDVLADAPTTDAAELDPFVAGLAALGRLPSTAPPLRAATAPRTTPSEPLGGVSTRDATLESTSIPVETFVDDDDPSTEQIHAPRIPASPSEQGPVSLRAPLRRQRWTRTPPLVEVDTEPPSDWLDRFLDEDVRKRLTALGHMLEGEARYDRFGLSVEAIRRTLPVFLGLYHYYFRVKSSGHENLPTEGPAILAANHGGLLPFDGSMIVMDGLLKTDPPRLPRAIVDHWAGELPFVNIFYARVGQVIGTRENFAHLLEQGQLVLVFPEGMDGVVKTIAQRYHLKAFHRGFIEQALQAGAPIIPTAVIGSDDQTPILFDLKPIAKMLGLPALPITPTFPWLGPLGLLPYPVGYQIVYGEPLRFCDQYGPEEADDPRLLKYLAKQVRREVQSLVDRHLSRGGVDVSASKQ